MIKKTKFAHTIKGMTEFLKVEILGSRIPDIICEKSGHFWKMNNSAENLPELSNNFVNQALLLVQTDLIEHIIA